MLSTSGDTHLGGDDFDKRIVDFLADDFKQNEGIDLRKDRQVYSQHFLDGCSIVLLTLASCWRLVLWHRDCLLSYHNAAMFLGFVQHAGLNAS